jgi:hypothetical protein
MEIKMDTFSTLGVAICFGLAVANFICVFSKQVPWIIRIFNGFAFGFILTIAIILLTR